MGLREGLTRIAAGERLRWQIAVVLQSWVPVVMTVMLRLDVKVLPVVGHGVVCDVEVLGVEEPYECHILFLWVFSTLVQGRW